jgi:hypothetical protein
MKLCAALVLLAMAWAAPAAGAAEITKRDPTGDVRGGAQIGKRGRAALDIVGVTARRDAAGLAVDVRLRGDFERLAGSGALKDPVAGIVLRRTHGRPGSLLTRGSDRRAQVRSKRAGTGPVVLRDGRVVRFRVAGDVSTVTKVAVRVAGARTASDSSAVALPRTSSGDAPCNDLAFRRSELEGRLGDVEGKLIAARTLSRRTRLRRERSGLEDFLFGLETRIRLGCPELPPSAGASPNGPGNQSPVASFTVSPPGPGFKAGQTLTFSAAGSRDPDGTIAGFVWSDGKPPHQIGTGVQLSRWYGAPGIYTTTLSVTDDHGGTAFASKTLFVGGQGTKTLRNPDNSKVTVTCPTPATGAVGGSVEILIPSYAADQSASTPNPCPDASLATTVSRVAGNTQGETDDWGRPRDTMRIAFQLQQVGPGAGNQSVPLDWSASWK